MTDKRIHGNYRVKTQSGECSAWYMKIIWKLLYQFTDAQINWLIIVYSIIHLYLYVTALLTSYIVKKQQIFSSLSFYKHYHLLWIVHMVFKIYWRRVLIFGSFCSVKLTGYPPVQYNYGCNKFFPKLECVCLSYYYQFCCSVVFCLTFSKKKGVSLVFFQIKMVTTRSKKA